MSTPGRHRPEPFEMVFGALLIIEWAALVIAYLVGGRDAAGVVSWYALGAAAVTVLGLMTWPWAQGGRGKEGNGDG